MKKNNVHDCEFCGQKTTKKQWLKFKIAETKQILTTYKTCKICRLYLMAIIPKAALMFNKAIHAKGFICGKDLLCFRNLKL